MPLPPEPDPQGLEQSYGFSKLFTEFKISLATLFGGPIAGFFMVQRNFLELREFDKARKTLVFGTLAILVYYPLLYWLTYRFFGLDLPTYAKILPPVLLEAVILLYQKDKLAEFLRGGAVRESLFASAKFILVGLVLEGAFFLAAIRFLPNMQGDKVVKGLNRHELYYQGMDEKAALELASTLESLGHLKGTSQVHLKAVREGGSLTLLFPRPRQDWRDLEVLAYHSMLLDDLERLGVVGAKGCFFEDAYNSLRDVECFTKEAVPLLNPIRDRTVANKLEVLSKVRGEIEFFRALFEEAQMKGKRHVRWERVPTLFIFASNGMGTVDPGNMPEALAEAYGSRENAIQGVRILAYSFQGLKWPDGDSMYLQYMEALDRLKANLEKVAEHWKASPQEEAP